MDTHTSAAAVETTAVPAWLAEVMARPPVHPRPRPGRAVPPLATDLDMGALLRFKSLMAQEHLPVQVARMCFDRDYAYERIATAHASAHDPLRRLALELFQTYHVRDLAAAVGTAGA